MTRPYLTLPPDQPSYEELVEMTMEQRVALPPRFHTPVWMDSSPGVFVCAVCWDGDQGVVREWPCAMASARGREVFDRERVPES